MTPRLHYRSVFAVAAFTTHGIRGAMASIGNALETEMSTQHRLTDIAQIKAFVRGGNARFTLVSTKTGVRFTYRVRASEDGKVHFVKVLTGPDNTNSYTFLGTIFGDGTYRHGARSKVVATAPSALAFECFFKRAARGYLTSTVADLEFWHEGRCGRCGRVLTVPESIATGFGPECAGIVGAVAPDMATTRTEERPYDATATNTDQHGAQVDAMAGDPMDEFDDEIRRREDDEERRRMDRKFGLDAGPGGYDWNPTAPTGGYR